jgi:glycosyltransferase involved in cell wall biosynthesis
VEHNNEALPLLSIVIATRNRIPYAISAIQSILEITDSRLELVVQDNSESRDLESYVRENIKDNRFRYRYTPPPFSSIDNFNAALELSTGEYLCLIGDDDGVNPEIMEAAAWAKKNDVDALTPRIISSYLWPNTGIPSGILAKVYGSELSILTFTGKMFIVDVKREVIKLMRNGGVYYFSFNLPKLYHGLVRRRCMNDIHEKIGTYLGGLSPDIFSVLAISEVAEKVIIIDYPLTIPGICPDSTSVAHLKGKHTGRIEDAPHFRDRGEYHWCELVPKIYSPETIWVDSGIAALRAMGRDDIIQELNLPKLAAYCIYGNREVKKIVLRDLFNGIRHLRKNPVNSAFQLVVGFIMGPGGILSKRLLNRFKIIIGKKIYSRIYKLENMVEATHALTQYLDGNGYNFSDCVRHFEK